MPGRCDRIDHPGMHHDHRRPRPRWEALAATVVLAAVAAPSAQAASSPKPTTWTKHVNRAVNAEQLGLPASASARSLGRMAIHRFAGELGLRGSLAGVRFALEQTPRGSKLRQLRFRQTVKGLRVLYSQIDVAVVEDRVSSISATVVPLMSRRLRGAKRVSAARCDRGAPDRRTGSCAAGAADRLLRHSRRATAAAKSVGRSGHARGPDQRSRRQ